jgi:hypothetical protein
MTPDDVKALTGPFSTNEHEFTYNKMIYLTEEAITRRLDEVDPAWSFRISLVEHRADKVVIYAAMTVCGVTRESNGYDAAEYAKNTERHPDNEVNQREKAALTDALKRCARMFGIGRYILDIPKDGKDAVKDLGALNKWLKENYGGGTTPPAPTETKAPQQEQTPATPVKTPPPPSTPSPDGMGFTRDTAFEFVSHWFKKETLSTESILKALGIEGFGDWKQSVADAHARVALAVQALKGHDAPADAPLAANGQRRH